MKVYVKQGAYLKREFGTLVTFDVVFRNENVGIVRTCDNAYMHEVPCF
jgi:hypothetical protein